MQIIIKIFKYLTGAISVAASVITIAMAVKSEAFSVTLLVCGIFLLCSAVFFYVQWLKASNKLCALRILAHRGKVHTINYLLYIDFLKNRFDSLYDNKPKTNSWHVKESEFHFLIQDNKNHSGLTTVDYKHRFHLLAHNGELDILILHAVGNLIRKPQTGNMDTGVYYYYQNQHHSIVPESYISDVNHANNQDFDRAQSSLDKIKGKKTGEWLTFHYCIENEYNLDEDEVFVIYPKNYGRKFSGTAYFHIQYEKPYAADIQLYQLPYSGIVEGKMESIAHFERDNYGLNYHCRVKSIHIDNVYFIIIKKKPWLA